MNEQPTHRLVSSPQITSRHLADFMAASETARRTIIRGCKYQPIARVIQHTEAKAAVSRFVRSGSTDIAGLTAKANQIRSRLADTDFDRDLLDHNADYVDRFIQVHNKLALPDAERLPQGRCLPIDLSGVTVNVEIHCRFRRLTQTNKVRVGAASLRYAKGKPLKPEVGEWQSAFLLGYLRRKGADDTEEPEGKLCITIDAYSGTCIPAPTDSVRRFGWMESACATIAERWPNIEPPPKAVLK